jgi:hypothetical protein
MRYLLLVCDDPAAVARLDDGERHGILPAYRDLTSALMAAGQLVAAEALEPVSTATTVRLRGGKRIVRDGPFADTPERVVGYYVIQADDLDQALAIAARVPAARYGAVEVRPIRRPARSMRRNV